MRNWQTKIYAAVPTKWKTPRVKKAMDMAAELVFSKQDAQGRWGMWHRLNGKVWGDIDEKGKPSKWVTLRAMRVLKAIYP